MQMSADSIPEIEPKEIVIHDGNTTEKYHYRVSPVTLLLWSDGPSSGLPSFLWQGST